MKKLLLIVAACGLAVSGAAFADTYKLDAKGACHSENGKFAKKEMCAAPAAAAAYKLDAKGKCRDAKGKFAKQDLCKA